LRRGGEKLIIEGVINYMDWTPDEKRLLFYTPPPLRWMTADVETRQLTEVALSHPEHGVSSLRYSPDGDWLTFTLRVEGTGFQLLISRVEGGQPMDHSRWLLIDEDQGWGLIGNRSRSFLMSSTSTTTRAN
jgi:dipeptidyl aminopeptidase/acylaminoacyl peptidase